MFEPTLTLVEDIHDAHHFLEWLGTGVTRRVLGVDTETTSLEWWTPDFLRTIQFGDSTKGFTIPLNWWYKVVEEVINNYPSPQVMHNAKFDIHALESAGFKPQYDKIHDTKVIAHLLDPTAKNSLKPLADKYIDPTASLGQVLLHNGMKKNGWTWATVPVEFPPYWSYAALDTCLTSALWEKIYPLLEKSNLVALYEMEMQTQFVMTAAEKQGAQVDKDYTERLLTTWQYEMQRLLAEIEELGVKNPNALRQIEDALRLEGWEPEDFTAKGNVRLDEGVLKGLDYPIVQKILDYKRLKKWTKAYLENFLKLADENGVLHASINTLAARTGRMSITQPALQTLPRGPEIRDCIVASPGRHLLAIDYSQIEYRLFAHFSQEESMINAMQSPDTDFHSATAKLIFGDNFTKQQRSLSKNCNFAWLYGAGPARLAATANKDEKVITVEEAEAILKQYASTFPRAAQFMQEVMDTGRQRELTEKTRPYIFTKGGRKLYAEINPKTRQYKYYSLVNFLCQGTAAEVLKEKLVELDQAGLADYLILPVHDELIFDIPDDEWDVMAKEIAEVMQDLDNFRVPLTVSVSKPLERWGQNYE